MEAGKASGLIEVIGEAIDAEYSKEVKDVNINPALIEEFGKDCEIVNAHHFTVLVKCWLVVLLPKQEFDSVQVVEAQAAADQTSQL